MKAVKKTALLVALSALLLSAMIAPVLAGPSDVVINVGDWFKYKWEVTRWISTDPFLPEGYFGALLLADNETNYILYSVTDITPSGDATNVTFLVTYNWKNGSETTDTMVESVSNTNTGQQGHRLIMIGADMSADEVVSESHDFLGMGFFVYPQRYINRTFDFANPTATRATNECNYTLDALNDSYNFTMWWDKATGMCIYYECHADCAALGGRGTAAYEFSLVGKLVDSSIDDIAYIPEAFTTAVMLVMLSASTVLIVLYRKRKLY